MEANRKLRKGLMKGKLAMSLYRATMPTMTTLAQPYTTNNNVTMPSYSPLYVTQEHQLLNMAKIPATVTTSASVGFIVNQEKVNPQPQKVVSYAIPESTYGVFENPYYGVVADESVDARAARYISCVQERFKLEQVS